MELRSADRPVTASLGPAKDYSSLFRKQLSLQFLPVAVVQLIYQRLVEQGQFQEVYPARYGDTAFPAGDHTGTVELKKPHYILLRKAHQSAVCFQTILNSSLFAYHFTNEHSKTKLSNNRGNKLPEAVKIVENFVSEVHFRIRK
jgi:hypothetical protein